MEIWCRREHAPILGHRGHHRATIRLFVPKIPLISKRNRHHHIGVETMDSKRALFRTWKFSVRPTSCTTTTRNFKLGWRLKWERYFRRHDTAIERHLRRRFEAELNRYSSVERMQFFFFFFLFREKLLIGRKCGDVHCASGPFI